MRETEVNREKNERRRKYTENIEEKCKKNNGSERKKRNMMASCEIGIKIWKYDKKKL